MHIKEVVNKKEKKDFFRLPNLIYKDDPNWIRHLDNDVRAVFDPEKNEFFKSGILNSWVLYNEQGKPTGRIAAFINKEIAYSYKIPTGGVGFFECIDDYKSAEILFDTAKDWLSEHDIHAMDGPINFGEKDRFWGLLVKGFHKPPPYLINYNPPYYIDLFERYGFKNYYEQYIYGLSRDTEIPPIVHRSFSRLTTRHGYEFRSLSLDQQDKFANDFMQIYNNAWRDVHKHFKPMTRQEALNNFKSMKAIIDEDFVIFAYHNDEPIAIFVGIPELNQIFKYLNGKFTLYHKLKFLFLKRLKGITTIYGIVFGIVPEHRNKGVESGLILSIQKAILKTKKYKDMYIAWIGDFNPKMINIVEKTLTKNREFTLITYRKYFDPNQKFERHPVLD